MKIVCSTIASFVLIFMCHIAVAQMPVVPAKDASKFLGDESAVFVSLRPAVDYQKVHITGAVNIQHTDLYGDMSMLKTPGEIATILGANGISANKKIFLYDNGSGRYAGRMYWILSYLGAQDVNIIDGGMKGWRMARKPVTKNPSGAAPTTFTPSVQAGMLATMAEVKRAVDDPGTVILDVRSPEEFSGSAEAVTRKGHIPSAVNLNYVNVMNERGMIKSAADLKQLFAIAGIDKDTRVILYCQSSVRAGIVFAALRGIGYSNSKVYDGAFLEWQSVASNPVIM